MLDMIMLALTGGQERTAAQYAELLGRAGFKLTQVIPRRSASSVIEALPTAWAPRSESCPHRTLEAAGFPRWSWHEVALARGSATFGGPPYAR
jgi:O-methyltransferase domain